MDKQRTKNCIWTWEATAAVYCFGGGLGAALAGTIFTVTAWALGSQLHPWLHGLGTALLIVTIPLLIFCGYCLDWEETRRSKSATKKSDHEERESLPN